ncbi:MAG TPA: S41 family peptidase [Longimicrobiaceae bacterium]|nr:S41 family peptidase [Longimicrobiaceae bacterium]
MDLRTLFRREPQPERWGATLPLEMRQGAVRRLDEAVRGWFAHWEAVPGLDYHAAVDDFRRDALSGDGRREFALAALAFLAKLRNGHTGYDDAWVHEHHGAPLPFGLRPLDGRWTVTWSRTDGLRPGDEVREIDGEPFGEFYGRHSRFIPASCERAAQRLLAGFAFLFPERFTLTLACGGEVPVVRQRPAEDAPASSVSPAASPASSSPDDAVPHRWIEEGRVGYMRIPSFDQPKYQERALDLLAGTFRGAPVLVVDLRGNGGGNTPWKLRKALMGGRRFRDAIPGPDLVPPPLADRILGPVLVRTARVPLFRGALVMLADGGTASAAEDLLIPLKDSGRATLVGDTTFGSTGQPHFLSFGDGITARIGARRVRFPDGSPFEGVGIAPHVFARVTPESLREARDVVLPCALDLISGGLPA